MEGSHHHGSQRCCGRGHGHGDGESCCGGRAEESGRLVRRFRSREERLACIEEYRKDLQEELKSVDERIAEMRSGA